MTAFLDLLRALTELFNAAVRPVVTLLLTVALVRGFIYDKVSAEAFLGIIGVVITFWFTSRQTTKDLRAAETPAPPTNGTPKP